MSNEINRNFGSITTASTTLTTGNITYSPSRTVQRSFLIEPLSNNNGSSTYTVTGWVYNMDANIQFGMQSTATNAFFWQKIPGTIHGATLASIDLYYQIANGVHAPATRLTLACYREGIDGSGAPLVNYLPVTAYATTGAGSVVTTNFVTNGSFNVIDNTAYAYAISIVEETGAGALAGNSVYSFRCNYTVTNDTTE